MSQSRRASAIEAATNTLIGYMVAVWAQTIILPLFGFHATGSQHMQIAALFTIVSIARSYCLRRLFNAIGRRKQR